MVPLSADDRSYSQVNEDASLAVGVSIEFHGCEDDTLLERILADITDLQIPCGIQEVFSFGESIRILARVCMAWSLRDSVRSE